MNRKVARIKKEILSLSDGNVFTIPTENDQDKKVVVTKDQLGKWVQNFHAMRARGIRIPAPWSHKGLALPTPKDSKTLVMGRANEGGMVDDASINAGFWENLWVDGDSLWGEVEAPGDVNDPNTPAGKLGTTVKEVSVYVAPKWKDGTDRVWDESIMHIGCVCHPIETNQRNFELVGGEAVIAMSMKNKPTAGSGKSPSPPETADPSGNEPAVGSDLETGDGDADDIGAELEGSDCSAVITLLQSAVGIVLPPSTNPKNFLERLEIALTQFQACSESDDQMVDDVTVPPEGATEKQAPFIMSFSPEQLSAFATAKVSNPATGKPWTLPELQEAAKVEAPARIDDAVIMAHPTVKSLVSTTEALLSATTEQAKSAYRARVARLESVGFNKEYLSGTLTPMIDGLVMSFENGKPKPQALDTILVGLEASIPAKTFGTAAPAYSDFLAMSHGVPAGATTVGGLPHPLTDGSGGNGTPSQEDVAARIKAWKTQGFLG